MKKQYLKVCNKLVEFLYNSQVKINDRELNLKREGSLNFTRLDIKFPDNKSYSFYLFINKDKQLFINKNNKFIGASGPYNKNEFFRLDPFITPNKEELKQKFTKTKLVKRLIFQLATISNHLKYGLVNYENRRLINDFLNKFKQRINNNESGGLLFKYINFKEDSNKLKISCYDNGGIFDNNLNGEGKKYSPRVMGAYYADAYAAYCFAKRYLETKNRKYLEASIASLDFIKRTYENYPKSFIWYHHDFKNPAYIETINLLKEHISKEKLESLISKLREDLYEPVNVFALRYHWRNARKYFGYKENNRKIKYCIKIIKKNQTKEGLILDKNKEDYKDAHDLTYHLYSLACLARAIKYYNNKKVKDIFLKGIEFSSNILTPNGEISYNGRGANNIYHLASAIYAFELAANLANKGEYKYYASLMFDYLKKWQNKDGSFPTAMNKYGNERMAWNHCHTPYNALVGYMLYNAVEENKNNKEIISLNKNKLMSDSRYFMFINKNYYFGFFGGCNKSYSWSEGTHISGIAGCSIIGTKNKGVLNLILDESIKDQIIVNDLPNFSINNKLENFYGKGNLKLESNKLIYKKKLKSLNFLREYILKEKEILVNTKIIFKKDCNLNCDGLIKVPEFKKGLTIKFTNSELLKNEITNKILSNPRGKGKLYLIGEIKNTQFKKGQEINYEYIIKI